MTYGLQLAQPHSATIPRAVTVLLVTKEVERIVERKAERILRKKRWIMDDYFGLVCRQCDEPPLSCRC